MFRQKLLILIRDKLAQRTFSGNNRLDGFLAEYSQTHPAKIWPSKKSEKSRIRKEVFAGVYSVLLSLPRL